MGLLLAFAVLVWLRLLQPTPPLVAFLDVAQGDATYIRTSSGEDLLIDGGPEHRVLASLGEVMPFSDRRIDLLVLTHPHQDHLEGFLEVIDRFEVGELWLTGVASASELDDRLIEQARARGVVVKFVRAGEVRIWNGDELRVLFPDRSLKDETIANLNDSSLVLRYQVADDCLIIPGDAEAEILNGLARKNRAELDCDILKASHHGSRDGTTREWLKAVTPAQTVISAGEENRFGHPHKETLELVGESKSAIFRTDQDGTIIARHDGQEWRLEKVGKGRVSSKSSARSPAED